MGSRQGLFLDVSNDVETLFSLLSSRNVALPLARGDEVVNIIYDLYNGGGTYERYTMQSTYSAGLHLLESRIIKIAGVQQVARGYWRQYASGNGDDIYGNDNRVRRVYINPRTAGLPSIVEFLEALAQSKTPFLFKHVASDNADSYTLRRADKCVAYINPARKTYEDVKKLSLSIPNEALDSSVPLFTRRIRLGISHATTPELDIDVLDWFTKHTGSFPSNSYGNRICTLVAVALQQVIPPDRHEQWLAGRYRYEELEKIKDHVKRLVIRELRKESDVSGEMPIVR